VIAHASFAGNRFAYVEGIEIDSNKNVYRIFVKTSDTALCESIINAGYSLAPANAIAYQEIIEGRELKDGKFGLESLNYRQFGANNPIRSDRFNTLIGWCFDFAGRSAPESVYLTLGEVCLKASRRIRTDIADRFGIDNAKMNGFSVYFDGLTAIPGINQCTIVMISDDGKSYYESGAFTLLGVDDAVYSYEDIIGGKEKHEAALAYTVDSISGLPLEAESWKNEDKRFITIDGWCFDNIRNTAGLRTYLRIGDQYYSAVRYSREDVAQAFNSDAVSESGFQCMVNVSDFETGDYSCSLIMLDDDGLAYSESEAFGITIDELNTTGSAE
jgi:hypothetical protein